MIIENSHFGNTGQTYIARVLGKHPESEQQLLAWYSEALKATWDTPNDIKAMYASASILKNSRVVFNICGNKYRLVVEINYSRKWVFIRFIGTHKSYDKIDVNSV